MYCGNCGGEVNETQKVCLKCGFNVDDGGKFCRYCGKEVNIGASICVNCGCEIKTNKTGQGNLNGKDKVTVTLLCFFLGGLGIHNFYMGEKKKGVMKIVFSFLCGISGIFALIDFIKILLDSYEYNPEASF